MHPQTPGTPRKFPVKIDARYPQRSVTPSAPYLARFGENVATKIVAADGSGDYRDIQQALDALPSNGGVVYIKEGTYTLTSTLEITKNNIVITGAGAATNIVANTAISLLWTNVASGTINNILIEKIKFTGTSNWGDNQFGVSIGDCTNFVIQDLIIEEMGKDGILLSSNASGCTVRNCRIYNCGYRGIWLPYGTDHIIENNIIHDIGKYGSGFYGLYVDGVCNRTKVINNTIYDCPDYGIVISGDYCTCIGNHSYNNGASGIGVTGLYCIIANNVVTGNDSGNTATYHGIELIGADYAIIIGNHCHENDGYELSIDSACDRVLYTGNHLTGSDHVGAIDDNGTNTSAGTNIVA